MIYEKTTRANVTIDWYQVLNALERIASNTEISADRFSMADAERIHAAANKIESRLKEHEQQKVAAKAESVDPLPPSSKSMLRKNDW